MPPRVQPAPTADEVLEVSSAQQYNAFGHPLRLRMLIALGNGPATIGQLAAALGSLKGNIAYHLKVLSEAGLVRLAYTQQVRGGTERYYQRSARRFDFVGDGTGAQSAMALHTVAEEIGRSPAEPFVLLRHLRLTVSQADQLTQSLTRLARRLSEAGPDQPRYGVVLGVYQQPEARTPDQAPDRPGESASGCRTVKGRRVRGGKQPPGS